MAVTLKQIAELAGVSRGTVDRALYNRGRVKPEVAERIRKIADDLGISAESRRKSAGNDAPTNEIGCHRTGNRNTVYAPAALRH